jgi:hypothetical protein
VAVVSLYVVSNYEHKEILFLLKLRGLCT